MRFLALMLLLFAAPAFAESVPSPAITDPLAFITERAEPLYDQVAERYESDLFMDLILTDDDEEIRRCGGKMRDDFRYIVMQSMKFKYVQRVYKVLLRRNLTNEERTLIATQMQANTLSPEHSAKLIDLMKESIDATHKSNEKFPMRLKQLVQTYAGRGGKCS